MGLIHLSIFAALTPFLLLGDMNPYVTLLLNNFLPIVATLLLAALLPIVHKLVKMAADWLHVTVTKEQEAKLDGALTEAVGHAEEYALSKAQSSVTVSGDDKMAKAITMAKSEIDRLGLPKLAEDALRSKLEATLNVARSPGDGPTLIPVEVAAASPTPVGAAGPMTPELPVVAPAIPPAVT